MLRHGVTTVEAKVAMVWIGKLKNASWMLWLHWIGIMKLILVSTFMAAHAIPTEYKGRSQEYLDLIVEQMLPKSEGRKAS